MNDGLRAIWIESRLRELPEYCRALWSLLLDRNLPPRFQEDIFATLAYVVDAGAGGPPGAEELAAALCCLRQLFAHLPQAVLAVHEEDLLCGGILIRAHLEQAPARLGPFHQRAAASYERLVTTWSPWLKSAPQRNRLLAFLRRFIEAPAQPAWTRERLERLEAALGPA